MAISEACKFEIKEEVDGMIDRGDVPTKSAAFDAMVDFYRTIGIEIKKKTIEKKYERASKPTNVGREENQTKTEGKAKSNEIKRAKDGTLRGGARPGAGRKPKNKRAYDGVCSQCGEKFYYHESVKDGLWHCIRCDHHWPMYVDECKNCHKVTAPSEPDVVFNVDSNSKNESTPPPTPPREPEPITWTCEECGGIFPMDVTECNCPPEKEKCKVSISLAMQYAEMAISQLQRIPSNDDDRTAAFEYVAEWIKDNQ